MGGTTMTTTEVAGVEEVEGVEEVVGVVEVAGAAGVAGVMVVVVANKSHQKNPRIEVRWTTSEILTRSVEMIDATHRVGRHRQHSSEATSKCSHRWSS
jgi:hypothetical protein